MASEIMMVVNIHTVVFKPCTFVIGTNVLEDHTAVMFSFNPEDGGSMLLRKLEPTYQAMSCRNS
jgi:hypothetical protein